MGVRRDRPKKHDDLTNALRAQVEQGIYGDRLPGIDGLALEFDVNRKTVNRSVNRLVGEGLLVRIPGLGTFVSDGTQPVRARPKEPRRRNSRRYALIVRSDDAYLGYMELLSGLEEEISRIDGCILYIRFDQKHPELLLGRLRYNKIEGVVICGLVGDELLETLRREFTTLLVDYSSPIIPTDSIVWESYDAGCRLGESLAEKGVQELLFVNEMAVEGGEYRPRPLQYEKRFAGLSAVLGLRGIRLRRCVTDWDYSNFDSRHEFAERIRDDSIRKALYCDMHVVVLLKLGCLDFATKIVMTGAGDYKLIKDLLLPGVYISHDMAEMGREAGKCIIDIIGRPSSREKQLTLTPAILKK